MVDWQKMILDLRLVVGSCRQIARLMKYKNPDYIGRLSRGEITDPPHSVGAALIKLHNKFCGEK